MKHDNSARLRRSFKRPGPLSRQALEEIGAGRVRSDLGKIIRMAFMRRKDICIRREALASLEGLADFPVVAEGGEDASNSPAVLLGDGMDDFGACGDGLVERGIRVCDDHDNAHGAAAKRFRAEIQML